MTLDQAKDVVGYMHDECHDATATVYEEYSGRMMYGEKTTAVVTNDLVSFGYACCAAGIDYTEMPTRVDNMGLEFVVY